MRTYAKKISLILVLFFASGICFELGLWQWHRAQAMHKYQKPQAERPVVELTSTANAGSNLRNAAFNRLVTFEAIFEKDYVAPNQLVTLANGEKVRKDVLVSLARLSDNRGILVVRGITIPSTATYGEKIRVDGRLYPRQNVDQAAAGPGKLSRLDPALVAGDSGFTLFDGYVVQTGGELAAPQLLSTGGAFYWQHIAYVITWWFMALLILSFPFYNRMRGSRFEGEEKGKVES
jgi:cytochrome oxidase assembly protein ShyY1